MIAGPDPQLGRILHRQVWVRLFVKLVDKVLGKLTAVLASLQLGAKYNLYCVQGEYKPC